MPLRKMCIRDRFKVLSSLMKDKRVTELVCATDAGREGELIFLLVYNKAGFHQLFNDTGTGRGLSLIHI